MFKELLEKLIPLVEPSEESSELIKAINEEVDLIESATAESTAKYDDLLNQFNEVSKKLMDTKEEMRKLFADSFKEEDDVKTEEEELEEITYDDLYNEGE